MSYTRTEVRSALKQARDAGKDCAGLYPDALDTTITLERWGFLKTPNEKVDARIADWYVAQGLAVRESDSVMSDIKSEPRNDVAVGVSGSTEAALVAAEAALSAAQAAFAFARQVAPPPAAA